MLPYIRLEEEESTESKRGILSSEIAVLNLAKNLSNYSDTRALEITKKLALRVSLKQASTKIDLLLSSLPSVETGRISKLKQEIKLEPKLDLKKKKNIELELEEIKEKLAQLH